MNSSYYFNMSMCNKHENNETNISFYNILLNACAKGTCLIKKKKLDDVYNQIYGTHKKAEEGSDTLVPSASLRFMFR